MNKPIISIKLTSTSYSGLANLGGRVAASLTGNANFATPIVTLVALQAATDDLLAAIDKWGPKGNRGSHADHVDMQAKGLLLWQLLTSEAEYVQSTSQVASGSDYSLMKSMIITSGFQLANAKTPQGVLEMVQNFHRFISRQLDANQVKLKWKRPLNTTSKGNVKSYKVFRGATMVFSAAELISVTTKTSFIDTNNTGVNQTWNYWVKAVSTNGDGALSDIVMVNLSSI